ncbi:MAG: hypothetical protein WD872_08485 [Pirellulaceae bacterium]
MTRQFRGWQVRWYGALVLAGLLAFAVPNSAQAERPVGPKLLPERTLAYLRVSDSQLLVERFRDTALGRIVQDEQVRPLVSQLYNSAQNAWKQLEERVGLPLDQLLKIPQGEICVAYVAPPEQRPGLVVLLDVKDQLPQFEKLLAKGESFLSDVGGSKTTEKIANRDVSVFRGPDGQQVYLLERDGTIVFASNKELLEFTLKSWDGGAGDKLADKTPAGKTLADNDKFNSIMNRCAGSVDDPPQITWFVDPIELVRTQARGSVAATGLALIPVLGLDGLKGVGGSLNFATGEFDQVQHMHVLLDNPRAGVVELVAMKSGDTTPENWVPADVISYSTLNWDFKLTFDKAAVLYNSLSGEGEFQNEAQRRIGDRLGVDFEKEVLPAMQGRVSYVQWIEKPVRINSITNLAGVKLSDPQTFQPTLQKVLDKFPDRHEKKYFGGVTYWQAKTADQQPEQGENDEPALRRPEPCLAIVGDYLLASDSTAALQAAILASTDSTPRLANELDYKLIASKIKRQVGGDAPGMIQFSRAEEGMRFWYEMAKAEDTKKFLSSRGEGNPLLRDVDRAFKDNPLPPFSVLAKYLAPGGGMMVNDETGLHYMSFTLRRAMK